ncbi:hypothetical protein H2200_008379 [Cladophialophora chaetospira]|uniref:NB-ARC domain-containing protein n=1 Tax=Cladophialophora chaetospira TaxID=386627 RepID=A0AA38X5T4_9EURO|nr:hypothetical protein H2200_008379 [Cladophialophora chaetospira]
MAAHIVISCLVISVARIVAVHGVGEDLHSAWTDKTTGLLWLRDLLPKDVQDIRVLSFGYNGSADSFFNGADDDPLYPTAETLVAYLNANRANAGCQQRPIIFICHGLGGLIVKQALLSSFSQRGPRTAFYHHVYICTYALVFFGTPHGRVTRDGWISKRPFSKSSDTLHNDADALTNINRAFRTITHRYQTLLLWEEITTHVAHTSAAPSLPDTEVAGIPRAHNDMCKFTRRDSSDYLVVIDFLRRQVKAAPGKTAFRWQDSLETLQHEREVQAHLDYGIPIAKPNGSGHCRQGSAMIQDFDLSAVFDPPLKGLQLSSDFIGREEEIMGLEKAFFRPDQTLKSDGPKVLIVYGMGGTGKTELCSQFAQRRRTSFRGIFTIKATSQEQIKLSFATIGTKAGFEATEKAGQHALSQQLTQPFLLIIDNADDPTLDVLRLLPDNKKAYILVTTRNAELRRLPKTSSLELKGLKEGNALRLLFIKAEIPHPWDDATKQIGNEICKTLGYLTLALVIAGSFISRDKYGLRLQEYLESYDERRKSYRPSLIRKDSSELAKDKNIPTAYPAFDLSLDYLERQDSTACKDAIEILNVVGFYHFERIGVDIFTKAVKNRSRMFETRSMPSIATRFLHSILGQPPTLLPDFLRSRSAVLEGCRVEDAIAELASLSLIRWEGDAPTFSLHPLIHAWAQDRLEKHLQVFYAETAFNTLLETIVLPTDDAGKELDLGGGRAAFHRRLLPHLDACLNLHPLRVGPLETCCSRFYLFASLAINPRLLSNLQQQGLRAGKCGYVYGECGKFQRSAEYLEMVKAALLLLCGPQHPRTMFVMLALAKVYWGLGKLDHAIDLQRVVVNFRKRILGPDHVDTLLAMDELGKSHWLNGQYTEALELSGTSMTQMRSTLGTEDDRTLAAMDNYGVALASWHRFHESADIHKEVLVIREKLQGPKNLDTLTSKNNLAMALLEQKQFDEARSLMEEVFEERKKQLGKEHPWTLWALCWLAKIKVKMGLLEEAKEMLIGGIEAGKRSLDENHLGVLMGNGELARVLSRQGHLNEAHDLLSDTVSRLQTSRGAEHPDSFYGLWKLSVLQGRLGRTAEACASCKLAFERAAKRLTEAHPLVGMIKLDLEGFQKSLSDTKVPTAERFKQPESGLEVSSLRRRFLPRTQLTW